MWTVILLILVLAVWTYELVLSSRLQSDRDIRRTELDVLNADLNALRKRIFRLEEVAKRGAELAIPEVVSPSPASVEAAPPASPPVSSPLPSPVVPELQPVASELSVAPPAEPELPPALPSTYAEPAEEPAAGQGWEAALGGSWLNKIGVLLLVIGLVLGTGYYYSGLRPVGRVAIALAVSALMLAGGAILERYEKYRVPARGLLGGGWAALYSTTYAAHAIEAARVIASPTLATVLLSAVALGMILHSLRYRSQVVTGVAYFVAFVTLAITQLTFFAVVALIPLAASLLYLAYRFRWTGVALAGLPCVYGLYLLHAARSSGGSLAVGQTVLLIYWLVFEGFEVFDSMRRRTSNGNPSAVFPLNAICFTAVSAMQWVGASQGTLYQFFALAAGAYLASSLVRALILPPTGFAAGLSALDRAVRGSYEGAVTLAAVFVAVAIALKLSGLNLAVALMAEAELLFLAGLQLRQAHLRHLATALFAVANLRLVASDVPAGKHITVAGGQWYAWSPVALLEAAVFYFNRFVSNRGAFYSSFAAGLLTLMLGFELPPAYIGLAWLLLAMVLFEFGGARHLRDFTIQSYCVGLVSWFALLMRNVAGTELHTNWHGWLPQLCAATLLYAVTTRIGFQTGPDSASPERPVLRYITSTAGTVMALVFLANILRLEFLGLAWLLLVVALYEFGLATRLREFVVQGYLAGSASFLALLLENVFNTGRHTDWYGWLPQLCGAVLLYAFVTRVGVFPKRDMGVNESEIVRYVASTVGTLLAATFLLNVLETGFVGLAWLLLAVVLYEFSLATRLPEFAVQGYLAGFISLLMLVVRNVFATDLHTDWHGWLPQLCATAVLYGMAARTRFLRGGHWSEAGRQLLCGLTALMGTVAAAAFLANTLPDAVRAIGWAALGLALLVIGTRLGSFLLRVQSYLLAVITFSRAWEFNLSVQGQFAGLPISIVTAAAVIASFYAAELLAPRTPANLVPGGDSQRFEARARFLFSWLGTLLLAALLFHEVSDRMRTVAWGLQGLGLLFAGFPLRERAMRLAGLVLLLVCVLKLFAWDLRNLEMPFRILSFLVLGVILIGVSFVYSRFRERISRYL